MAFLGFNIFDKAFGGQYNEDSVCFQNMDCISAKDCINNVCMPLRGIYGETLFVQCKTDCQSEPYPKGIDDLICSNPRAAYNNYNYVCPGYEPKGDLLGVSSLQVIGLIIFLVILYIIIFKLT